MRDDILAGIVGTDSALTASLVQNAMIIAGIGTLIQLYPVWKIGSRLPIVAATVVTGIGFSLLAIGANSFAGGQGAEDFGSVKNWIVGTVTLLSCLGFAAWGKGYVKSLSVLGGLIVGYILAACMGMVHLSFEGIGIVALPEILPFKPEFNLGAILSIVCIFLVSATETIGDTSALTSSALNRDITQKELSGSIACSRCGSHQHSPGCSRRLYHHDVRLNHVCRLQYDFQVQLLYSQHEDRVTVSGHRTWFHPGSRHVRRFPSDDQDRVC